MKELVKRRLPIPEVIMSDPMSMKCYKDVDAKFVNALCAFKARSVIARPPGSAIC